MAKEPKQPSAADPYAHRAHRVKYQQGYGAEGAARGKSHVGGDSKGVDPRLETEKKEDARESSYEPAQQE